MRAEGWAVVDDGDFDRETALLSTPQWTLVPQLARRLIDLRPMRWRTLGRYAKGKLDRVDVEEVVQALYRAGWLALRHRRDGAGAWQPTQLRLRRGAVEAAVVWVDKRPAAERANRLETLQIALRARLQANAAPIAERALVQRLFGETKRVRIRDYRAELEAALGVTLEQLVRFHVDTVLTAGPVSYVFGGVAVDLRGSAPWMAVTEQVARELTELRLHGVREVVCVENQTAFESLLVEGIGAEVIVVFTAGFLGRTQRLWLEQLIGAGVRRVRHWGDLDPSGLEIFRDLMSFVRAVDDAVEVAAWRMEPGPLEREDARPLNAEDWVTLHRYLGRAEVPLRAAAEAMARLGRKIEQEALLAGPVGDAGWSEPVAL